MENKPFAVGCVIMASGLAKRFGSNKLLADFGGEPMLCRAFAASDGIFSARLVVTRSAAVQSLCEEHGIPVLLHALPYRSDTVRLGLEALLHRFPAMQGCVFLPGDQPLLRQDTLRAMTDAFCRSHEKERNIFRLCRQKQGFPAVAGSPVLFGNAYFDELRHLPEGKGGGVVLKRHPERVCLFPAQYSVELEDADTPEALQRLREWKPPES